MKSAVIVSLLLLTNPLVGQGVRDDGSIDIESTEWTLIELIVTINRMIVDFNIEQDETYFLLARKYVIKCEKFLSLNQKSFTDQEINRAKHFLEKRKSLLIEGGSITALEKLASFHVDNLILKLMTQSVLNRELDNLQKKAKKAREEGH